ncbi:glycosyltransferase [Candidatus Uhrbacteria bacterium]|nr:glycosyltransferase [Candidatus Uhrbacteria bacterium]
MGLLSNKMKQPGQKIKVVQIITALGVGGAERLLLDLAGNLDQAVFDVTVMTVVGGGALEDGLRLLDVPVLVNHKRGKLGLLTLWRIYRQIKKIQPDIVHTHLFGGDTWGRLAAHFAGVPIIISTAHNTDLDEGVIKKFLKKFLAGWTYKVVAVSEAVKKYSIEVEKIPSAKLDVIHNGVRILDFFQADPKILSGTTPTILVMARLAPQKGHAVLFKALTQMKNQNVKVILAGDGPEKGNLQKLAASLGLASRVEFRGAKNDMTQLLPSCDIVALPSLWEGLGIVLIEASLAGRAIVASSVGGVPEVVQAGQTGLLVPPGEVAPLAQALDWLTENPLEASKMGIRARDFALKFDIKEMAKAYGVLYFSSVDAKPVV